MYLFNNFVASAAAAVGGAVVGGISSAIGWGTANAATIQTVAGAGQAVSGYVAEQEASEKQKKLQKEQTAELKKQQDAQLEKRKTMIDTQRKQIMGAGDSDYSINVSGTPTDTSSGSLTGVSLG